MSKRFLGELELNRIYQRECIEGMRMIPDKSIDMILCDLPYGTTACKWDTIVPFEPLWEQYERVIKDNGAIVLSAANPFASKLINSNIEMFRHEWIWNKVKPSNFLLSKKMPLYIHEYVLVFGKKGVKYVPQMTIGKMRNKSAFNKSKFREGDNGWGKVNYEEKKNVNNLYYPKSIIEISNANQKGKLHPTQKPVELFEYLIKTYTNEGDIVLDNCIGSGTTAIAALRTGRQFIGFELESEYVEIANKRIENEMEAN